MDLLRLMNLITRKFGKGGILFLLFTDKTSVMCDSFEESITLFHVSGKTSKTLPSVIRKEDEYDTQSN